MTKAVITVGGQSDMPTERTPAQRLARCRWVKVYCPLVRMGIDARWHLEYRHEVAAPCYARPRLP